MTCSRI